MIRTAITGSGRTLPYYLNIIRDTPDFLITGLFSLDKQLPIEYDPLLLPVHCNSDELADNSDALIVTDNAGRYFELITKFLKKSRHVLILADSSLSFHQVKKLSKIAEEAGVSIHIHHNTTDSSVIEKIKGFIIRPEYLLVKTHVNTNGGDTSKAIPEVLYREIYSIFELNPYNIKDISIKTVPFCSSNPDVLNVTIEFENGMSSHLIISSFNEGKNHLLEVYSPDRMVSYNRRQDELLLIDKISNEVVKINLVKGQPHFREKEIFLRFSKYILKKLLPENRFTSGIAAYQAAAAIINQIIPSPIEN